VTELTTKEEEASESIGATPAEPNADEKRNFVLIVINGIMTGGPSMLFDPSTVMAAFIIQLTGSQTLVGLVSGLMMVGWVWPQLLVANWIEPKPRKLFVYRIGAIFRVGILVAICLMMWLLRTSMPVWFGAAFVGLFFLYWTAGGFSGVAWYEVLSKTVQPHRRPAIFAWRQTGAGLFALVAGFVVTWALSDHSGMVFPVNYLFLLSLMTGLIIIGMGAFVIVREPYDYETATRRRPWKQYFRMGTRFVRDDRNYRRILLGQFAFAIGVMATPFLVPYLIREVGAGASVVGALMALAAAADLVMNIYWGHLGTQQGNRAVLVQSSRIALISPFAALAALFVPSIMILGIDIRIAVIAFALVISRVAGSGIGVGRMNYLLDIAPVGVRPSYIGFMNTFSIFSMLVPIAAGGIIDSIGYLPVFGTATVFGIVSILITLRLDNFGHGASMQAVDQSQDQSE
jgi:MFS family permease